MGEFGALDSYHLKSTKAPTQLNQLQDGAPSSNQQPQHPWATPTWLLFGSSRFGWAEAGDFKVCTIHHDEPSPFSASLKWISLDTVHFIVWWMLSYFRKHQHGIWCLAKMAKNQHPGNPGCKSWNLNILKPGFGFLQIEFVAPTLRGPEISWEHLAVPPRDFRTFIDVDHHVKVHWTTVVLSAWPGVRVSTLTSYLQTPTCNSYLSMISFQFHMKSMDTQT